MKDLHTINDRLYREMKSNVCARRCYVIIIRDNKIWFAGGWGQAKRDGLLSWYLTDMYRHNVKSWEYTYKKDFDIAVEKIKRIIREWEEDS